MKYKFNVSYIHDSFVKAHVGMSQAHPDFIAAISHSEIETSHNEPLSIEQVRQNIIDTYERDLCTVINIEGSIVE